MLKTRSYLNSVHIVAERAALPHMLAFISARVFFSRLYFQGLNLLFHACAVCMRERTEISRHGRIFNESSVTRCSLLTQQKSTLQLWALGCFSLFASFPMSRQLKLESVRRRLYCPVYLTLNWSRRSLLHVERHCIAVSRMRLNFTLGSLFFFNSFFSSLAY